MRKFKVGDKVVVLHLKMVGTISRVEKLSNTWYYIIFLNKDFTVTKEQDLLPATEFSESLYSR